MAIPKNIWALWLDFNNNADGVFNQNLVWFKDRIISQHPGWNINIISKWDDLINHVSEDKMIMKLLENKYVKAPNKSDYIRLFLLNKYGGFWVDISIFLLCPLDIYFEKQPQAKFICYYSDHTQVESMILKPLSEGIDSIKYHKFINKMKKIQKKYITLNPTYEAYTFMPENWFIGCVPEHPIIKECISQLNNLYAENLKKFTSPENYCFYSNLYISKLSSELFDIHYLDLNMTNVFNKENFSNKNYLKTLLENTWNCAYLTFYLIMYKVIVKSIKSDHSIIEHEQIDTFSSTHKVDLCRKEGIMNSCENIVIRNPKNNDVVYLLSYSYNKLLKWQNSMENRVSLHGTLIEQKLKLIHTAKNRERIIDNLVSKGFYLIKFSAWTRNSPFINLLRKKVPSEVLHGKTKKRQSKNRRTRKRAATI